MLGVKNLVLWNISEMQEALIKIKQSAENVQIEEDCYSVLENLVSVKGMLLGIMEDIDIIQTRIIGVKNEN